MKNKNTLEKITKAIEAEIEAFGEVMDVSKFKELQKQLEKFLIRDALTLTLNRWKFEEVLKREMKRSKTNGTDLCLMMIDIDKFKSKNDVLGHIVGDRVLQEVAWQTELIAEETIGKSHRIGRWGGEEFIYIFPLKNIKETKVIAEKIREHIDGLYLNDNLPCATSVSIGVVPLKKKDVIATLIKRADKAMYKAKAKGGNRIEIKN